MALPGANRHRVEQCLEAGEDAGGGETRGGDIEPAGAIAGEAAPVGQPAEAPLHHPATREQVWDAYDPAKESIRTQDYHLSS